MKYILLLISLACLSACSITSPKDTGKRNMLALESIQLEQKRRTRKHIIVNHPATASELDTYRIALLLSDGKRDYAAGGRWSEFLPSLVQTSLIGTLNDSKLFANVSSDLIASNGRYRLDSEIHHFEAHVAQGEMTSVHIEMGFAVKDLRSLRSITKFTLSETAMTDHSDFDAINRSFEQAYTQLQQALVKKLAKTL